jgi:hypothetical protein
LAAAGPVPGDPRSAAFDVLNAVADAIRYTL